jgi:hypothetical protein
MLERVLFIGTQFSILYTSVYPPFLLPPSPSPCRKEEASSNLRIRSGFTRLKRVIREINSCESERLREGEREVQTGQDEMRADTPALEQTQSSQQYV